MSADAIVFYIFVIFTGAALLATVGLYARQSLLVVYMLLGVLAGPSVLGLVSDAEVVKGIAHIGVIFLLFLIGINLPPQKLMQMLGKTSIIAGISSVLFMIIGTLCGIAFGFGVAESLIMGAAMVFSSTIIGLKLLPTTVLHHQHIGEIIISILLLQDILAIFILMLLPAQWHNGAPWLDMLTMVFSLLGLIAFAYLFERYVLIKLIRRFNRIHEYIFLVAIGWCLGMAELAEIAGLSAEVGAFIAGVALATSPIALFIGDNLRPLRDFFLVIFFFALGAGFELDMLGSVLWPSLVLALLALVLKPLIFKLLLVRYDETDKVGMEVGVRLGQISEFSLFIAVLALELDVIGQQASYVIQLSTMLTFVFSSYFIVMRYPSPIALSDELRRD
ncbi:sodium:proton antiporter [Candidatus Tenderia electrophaga]|jgi:Kef-type K+ transport system membrane component KefB|uniref:Sodium:proton antiporter n=1 Tax=Candidatus Tenderia electrophaga TaxID=1748243 RepID=A0A0S2TAP3_9GAMM|nr:sodium:proton antiporter [Candidatus Tenderia electrophaga]